MCTESTQILTVFSVHPTCPAFSIATARASIVYGVHKLVSVGPQTLPSRVGNQTISGSDRTSTSNNHLFTLSLAVTSSHLTRATPLPCRSSRRKRMTPSSPFTQVLAVFSFVRMADQEALTFVIYLVDFWTSCLAPSTNYNVSLGVARHSTFFFWCS